MSVQIDGEFFNRHANVIINVSSKERLSRLLDYLVNCPDPTGFSYEGKHYHFFIVTTRPNEDGKFAVHVSRQGYECIAKGFKSNG